MTMTNSIVIHVLCHVLFEFTKPVDDGQQSMVQFHSQERSDGFGHSKWVKTGDPGPPVDHRT